MKTKAEIYELDYDDLTDGYIALQAEVERLRKALEKLWYIYTNEDRTGNASDVFRTVGWPKEGE